MGCMVVLDIHINNHFNNSFLIIHVSFGGKNRIILLISSQLRSF